MDATNDIGGTDALHRCRKQEFVNGVLVFAWVDGRDGDCVVSADGAEWHLQFNNLYPTDMSAVASAKSRKHKAEFTSRNSPLWSIDTLLQPAKRRLGRHVPSTVEGTDRLVPAAPVRGEDDDEIEVDVTVTPVSPNGRPPAVSGPDTATFSLDITVVAD